MTWQPPDTTFSYLDVNVDGRSLAEAVQVHPAYFNYIFLIFLSLYCNENYYTNVLA